MSLISAHDIAKRYGARTVLDGVSLTIEPRDRIGLIGVNGSGKSTLIRVLVGLEIPDSGEIQRKRGLTYRLVEQFPKLDLELTIREAMLAGQGQQRDLHARWQKLQETLATTSDETKLQKLIEEQSEIHEAIERAGGWDTQHRADAVMEALGLFDAERILSSLSVGEARRVALGRAFLEQPDLLILDEPTNHLDVEAIEWLEKALENSPFALVLVTHDRYFLDRVANRHAEIDRGDLRLYEGNYSDYLLQRAERDAMEAKTETKRRRAIDSELEWVRRKAAARTTKQRARLERFDALVANIPKASARDVRFRLPHPPRVGKTILELRGISKSLGGRRLIANLDLTLTPASRIGIVGPNGAGKTTLLRIIQSEIPPDSGTVVLGANTEITYADQRRADLDETKSVLAEVSGESDTVFIGDQAMSVHSFLDGLLFDSEAQRTPISALSGGERSRVALAKALRVRANLLILDEPTNDLDLPTLRVLEDALLDYPGCALIVSHDRYFLDRVSTAILAFEGDGKVVLYQGSYDAFRERKAASQPIEPPERPLVSTSAKSVQAEAPRTETTRARRRSYAEEREFQGMETRIMELEAQIAGLETELADPEALRRLGTSTKEKVHALEKLRADLEQLYSRWAELSAFVAYGA